tara:strand:- start:297 stop:404 length:108 start_codon:yes stop_codon:yes gene_type:complete
MIVAEARAYDDIRRIAKALERIALTLEQIQAGLPK